MSIPLHPLKKPVFTAFFGITPLHTPPQNASFGSENGQIRSFPALKMHPPPRRNGSLMA